MVNHAAEVSTVVHGVVDDLLGELVQLLHLLTLNILPASFSQDIDKPCFRHLPLNQLGGQSQIGEDIAEVTRRLRMLPLLFHDVPIDGYDSTVGHSFSPPRGLKVKRFYITPPIWMIPPIR